MSAAGERVEGILKVLDGLEWPMIGGGERKRGQGEEKWRGSGRLSAAVGRRHAGECGGSRGRQRGSVQEEPTGRGP